MSVGALINAYEEPGAWRTDPVFLPEQSRRSGRYHDHDHDL